MEMNHPIFVKMSHLDLESLKEILSKFSLVGIIHDGMFPQDVLELVEKKSGWTLDLSSPTKDSKKDTNKKQEEPLQILNELYASHSQHQHLQKRMIQNEKMAAIGHLVKNIAHQLHHPLTEIRSLCQTWMCEKSDKSPPHLYSDLKEVDRAAGRCQRIIKSLLEFAAEGGRRESLSLNDMVQTTLLLLQSVLMPFDCQVEFSASEDTVLAQPDLLRQVIFNIVHNACQASKDGDRLYVKVYKSDPHFLCFEVQDFGVGIADEDLQKIFSPFFTTKGEEGTGLGLSISQKIIESFNGRIHVTSVIGQGTTFRVNLPLEKKG